MNQILFQNFYFNELSNMIDDESDIISICHVRAFRQVTVS